MALGAPLGDECGQREADLGEYTLGQLLAFK